MGSVDIKIPTIAMRMAMDSSATALMQDTMRIAGRWRWESVWQMWAAKLFTNNWLCRREARSMVVIVSWLRKMN